MALKIKASEADQTNLNRLWVLQANRTSHLKNLSTIYKQKQAIKAKSEKQHIQRQRKLQSYHLAKLKDFNNRNKSLQDKINYENSLLRNKILQVYDKHSPQSRTRSVFINSVEKISPFNALQAEEIYQSNLRIGQRLTSIKSEAFEIHKLKQHAEKYKIFLEMVSKKSPKKKAYLKSLTKSKNHWGLIEDESHFQKLI